MDEINITVKEAQRRASFGRWVSTMVSRGAAPVSVRPAVGTNPSPTKDAAEAAVSPPPAPAKLPPKATTAVKVSSPYIIRFTGRDAHLGEEYRKLKSAVLAVLDKNADRNAIMVTSAESGEGKSLTAVNLALVLAKECDRTVLLVDADFRRPMLHTYLGVDPAPGLADCIADRIDVHSALVKTSIPGLSFLAAGKKTDTPAELLSSERMKSLLREIKGRYRDRLIIFDTPPALIFAETRVLGSLTDGIVFVVKEGVAINSVRDGLAALKGGPVLGIVYNGVCPEQFKARYRRYHKYYGKQDGNGT